MKKNQKLTFSKFLAGKMGLDYVKAKKIIDDIYIKHVLDTGVHSGRCIDDIHERNAKEGDLCKLCALEMMLFDYRRYFKQKEIKNLKP